MDGADRSSSPHQPARPGISSVFESPTSDTMPLPELFGDPGPSTARHRQSSTASASHSESEEPHIPETPPSSEDSDAGGNEGDYERRREKLIRENERLMAEVLAGAGDFSSLVAPTPPTVKRRKLRHLPKFDRNGYIVQRAPGQRVKIACVEIRTSRPVRRAIDNGEYIDFEIWAKEEMRRRRLALNAAQSVEAREGSNADTDGHGPGGEHTPRLSDLETSALGTNCHQCKRKSDKPKMQCRNLQPECHRMFCITCCKRYDDIEFDEQSRSFICPFCAGCCNCGQCLHKRGLDHLVGKRFGVGGDKSALAGATVQEYVEKAQSKVPPFDRVRLVNRDEDVESPPLPKEWEEWLEDKRREALGLPPLIRATKREKKGKPAQMKKQKAEKKAGEDGKGARPKASKKAGKAGKEARPKSRKRVQPSKAGSESALSSLPPDRDSMSVSGTPPPPILLRFKIPRRKEVDSDGDTLEEYSDEEMSPHSPASRSQSTPRSSSSLTSLPSTHTSPSSSQSSQDSITSDDSLSDSDVPDTSINDYLARIATTGPSTPGILGLNRSHLGSMGPTFDAELNGDSELEAMNSMVPNTSTPAVESQALVPPHFSRPILGLSAICGVTLTSATTPIFSPERQSNGHRSPPTPSALRHVDSRSPSNIPSSRALAAGLGIDALPRQETILGDMDYSPERVNLPKAPPREASPSTDAEDPPPPYPPPRASMYIPVDRPPRRRRPPPPAAHIVRAPKFSRTPYNRDA